MRTYVRDAKLEKMWSSDPQVYRGSLTTPYLG
jgi:hypothetical protein